MSRSLFNGETDYFAELDRALERDAHREPVRPLPRTSRLSEEARRLHAMNRSHAKDGES